MLVKITDITLDFSSDEEYEGDAEGGMSPEERNAIIAEIYDSYIEVDSEDDIADVISDKTGWLVESLSYDIIFG